MLALKGVLQELLQLSAKKRLQFRLPHLMPDRGALWRKHSSTSEENTECSPSVFVSKLF